MAKEYATLIFELLKRAKYKSNSAHSHTAQAFRHQIRTTNLHTSPTTFFTIFRSDNRKTPPPPTPCPLHPISFPHHITLYIIAGPLRPSLWPRKARAARSLGCASPNPQPPSLVWATTGPAHFPVLKPQHPRAQSASEAQGPVMNWVPGAAAAALPLPAADAGAAAAAGAAA